MLPARNPRSAPDRESENREARKTCEEGKKRSRRSKTLSALVKQYPAVQLATLVDAPPEGEQWLHEIKFDGYRLLGFLSGGEVCSAHAQRARLDIKVSLCRRGPGRPQGKDAVLDMEAVVLDENGKSGFQALQAALGEGGPRERIVAYAFDLLHLDGKDLTCLNLTERKREACKTS